MFHPISILNFYFFKLITNVHLTKLSRLWYKSSCKVHERHYYSSFLKFFFPRVSHRGKELRVRRWKEHQRRETQISKETISPCPRGRREFPHINRSQEDPRTSPLPILSRNPTPERTSPHSRHGECIGMRSSKSKTSNSYPPHPKRDVAGSRRSSPFHRKLLRESFSFVSTMRGENTWKITRRERTTDTKIRNRKSAVSLSIHVGSWILLRREK